MGRFVLAVMAVVVWVAVASNGYAIPEGLGDKLWLVALFPAVYILAMGLLSD